MKKLCMVLATLFLFTFFGGCAKDSAEGNVSDEPLPEVPEESVVEDGENKYLMSGNYRLDFIKGEKGYGITVVDLAAIGEPALISVKPATLASKMFYQPTPANVKVRGKSAGLIGGFSETVYQSGYSTVKKESFGYRATAKLTTNGGSELLVEDKFTLVGEGLFKQARDVKVVKAAAADVGFASTVSYINFSGSSDNTEFEYFIPSILYKDTANMRSGSIASNLELDRMYVKETRTGLPLAMAREIATGKTLTIVHTKPEISTGSKLGGGISGDVSDELQFGAIGYSITPRVSIDFVYPSSEGPTTYNDGQGWSKRYHEMRAGNVQGFDLALIPDRTQSYNDAMVNSWKKAYMAEAPKVADMDMDAIYNQNMDLFKAEYKEFGTNADSKSMGMPWSLSLPEGEAKQGYSFQMGFVGQQIPVGYQMYRYGLDHNDAATKAKGKAMVDFWSGSKIMSTYFPTVWWDPANNASGGGARNYPAFLRCMVDGMEGMIDAYRISVAYGEPQQQWRDAFMKVANNLTAKQNADGSFYRAYSTSGSIASAVDGNTLADSKLNTPVAVRFLAKVYEMTGDEKFKAAAVKAAQFCYDELYLKLGKYVGGTPDNPNTVDKEAAIFGTYAFDAAYMLTGDEKFLKAAEHASVCAMSWTYCYDFKVPSQNSADSAINPFEDGGVIGFSVIATGHSGADNFSAYTFYAMYRLYVLTGDEFFLNSAKFLQNNTKLNTDYDGRKGYKYRALMPEATNVADLKFASVNAWLPWASIANIEPIVNTYETFGSNDLYAVTKPLSTLKTELNAYGVGGKPLSR